MNASKYDIVFFEIDAVNVGRYYLEIFDDILSNKNYAVLIEDPSQAEKLVNEQPELNIICLQEIKKSELNILFRGVGFFIINGQRIPDTYLTMVARQQECRVLYVQHGFYVNEMKRGISFFFQKINKTLRYLSYSLKAALIDKNVSLFIRLVNAHIFGWKRDYKFKRISGFPDKALVFSEYWKIWHLKNYFHIPGDDFLLIGSPELNRFETTQLPDNYVTYCYQTILEDGRISKDYFIKVLNTIIEKVENGGFSLVIKGHPRMSDDMVEYFRIRGIQLYFDVLPVTNFVIGHYSSLLPLWVHYGSVVYSIELDGHDLSSLSDTIRNTSISVSLDKFNLDQAVDTELDKLQKAVKYYCNFNIDFKEDLRSRNIFESKPKVGN